MRILDTDKTACNLKKMIKESGMSGYKISKIMLIERGAVYAWVHGRNLPSLDNLVILSGVLNCSLDDIVVYTEEE